MPGKTGISRSWHHVTTDRFKPGLTINRAPASTTFLAMSTLCTVPGAHQNVRYLVRRLTNGFQSGVCSQCDLHAVQAPCPDRPGQSSTFLRLPQDNNRDQAALKEGLRY